MPSWLPGVLTAVALSAITNYVSVVIMVRLTAQAMGEHARRIALVEEKKLDTTLHFAMRDDLINRIDGVADVVKSLGHRVNGVDQRITAVDDRIKGVA